MIADLRARIVRSILGTNPEAYMATKRKAGKKKAAKKKAGKKKVAKRRTRRAGASVVRVPQ
jgi:hypothetical protein